MKKLEKTIELLNEKGLGYVLKRAISKVKGERIPRLEEIQQLFTDKSGLEVGGPSPMFRDEGFASLYKVSIWVTSYYSPFVGSELSLVES